VPPTIHIKTRAKWQYRAVDDGIGTLAPAILAAATRIMTWGKKVIRFPAELCVENREVIVFTEVFEIQAVIVSRGTIAHNIWVRLHTPQVAPWPLECTSSTMC
jgi:hypothetical protein